MTGLAYRAEDPELLLWVHAGMVDSIVSIVQRYGRYLDTANAHRYVAEMARFAEIIGVPEARVPSSVAALREYLESVPLRQITPGASEAIAIVLDPPGLDVDTRELWHDLGQVAVGTLPAWARSMYGFAEPPLSVSGHRAHDHLGREERRTPEAARRRGLHGPGYPLADRSWLRPSPSRGGRTD